jgi:ABC-type transport system involved in cytochrome bd biosynthesis fused ATPase/permease subunit
MKIALLLTTIIANAVMDAVISNDSFRQYGKWFSREGWEIKHELSDYFSQFMPSWLAEFIWCDFLVVFTELFKFAKMVMILSFLILIFGLNVYTFLLYLVWGMCFSILYAFIR